MSTTIKLSKSISKIIQEEALKVHRKIKKPSKDDINYIIWNHTGYPCFWSTKEGETVEDCFRRQIREFFSKTPKQIKSEEADMAKKIKKLQRRYKKELNK